MLQDVDVTYHKPLWRLYPSARRLPWVVVTKRRLQAPQKSNEIAKLAL